MKNNINLLNYTFIEDLFIKANSDKIFEEDYQDIMLWIKNKNQLTDWEKYIIINYVNDYINKNWWKINREELFLFFEQSGLLYKEISIKEDETNIYLLFLKVLMEEIENFIYFQY